MNTLEQLSLEAFQLALNRLEEPLPEALAQQVQHFSENWEAHIGELRTLTEQFEPLKTQYQAARLELQSQSADRKQYISNGFQAPPESSSSESNGHSNPAPSTTEVAPPAQQPIVYRYTLPSNATSTQMTAFTHQVEAIRQANPDWVVVPDRPQSGEADAIVIIHKDEQYAQVHAAYITNRTLNDIVAPALSRVFRNRS
jgi:hypothetical protein